MPFSDDERSEVKDSLRRIEEKQVKQEETLSRLVRIVDDTDENGENGLKSKVEFVYEWVRNVQERWKGARFVIVFGFTVVTSGVGLLVYNLVQTWLSGGAGAP